MVLSIPLLVICGDRGVRSGHAQDIAERISDARLGEFDGDDSVWFAGDADSVLDEVETFLTGQRGAPPSNRVLSTVLFTDIVGSTERATQLGDEAWAAALAAHDRMVERHVTGARGVVVKFTGDGVLATFDGPARRSTARARSATRWRISAYRFAPDCTPARRRWATGTFTASRCTSRHGSCRWLGRPRCWCRA